ncbi:integrase [Clostridium perfringens]|nr:integrase [Clostridium perfringens]
MGNVIKINQRKKYNFLYLPLLMPINNELIEYQCIYETGSGNYKVHMFTEFIYNRIGTFSLKNKSANTIKNFYLTFIIRFLNFIFNDSETPIDNIEDLSVDMIEEFLNKFAQGKLPNDGDESWRSKETVGKANNAINYFIYWLCWKKDKDRKKVFKMKYIKESDFTFTIVKRKSKDGLSIRESKRLETLVVPKMSRNVKRRVKTTQAGEYTVRKLLETAKKVDPLLVFGIILGAYCGLRVGYITQMYEGRFHGLDEGVSFGAYIDFKNEVILRSDNKPTSNLKKRTDVPIYPGCTDIVYRYFKEHINILKSKGLYPNKYGALFVTERGKAMTDDTYFDRFSKVYRLTEILINEEASEGVHEAIVEQQILLKGKMTPHSLRHYYKQLIEQCERSPRVIQFYLTHSSLDSQVDYSVSMSTEEGLRRCRDAIYSNLPKQY